jgi:hypothetical protein
VTPKSYSFKFIEPGIISYADTNQGVVFVSKEALDRMAPTIRGCPVIFVPEKHNGENKENAFNFDDIGANTPAGIISDMPYWKDDGFQWVNGWVWDEDAQAALDQANADMAGGRDPTWSCSCAYNPEEDPNGGVWHELEYDAEVVNGKYMHMAIVPRGRYEQARVYANSKGGPSVALFGIGKKNAEPAAPAVKPAPAIPEKKEEPAMLNADATVDVNGTPVPLYELIEKYQMSKGSGNVPPALTPEDEVALPDGSKVKVSELIAVYGAGEGAEAEPMANAEPPTDTAAEPVVDPARQVRANAAPAKPAPKVNQALKNAANRGGDPGQIGGIDSEATRLDRGKARYSIPVKQGGK